MIWADVREFELPMIRFSNFSKGIEQYHSEFTLLKWNSRYMTSFAEETGDHLLRSASSTNNFRWICLVFEDPPGGL